MFMSRLMLNPNSAYALNDILNPNEMHKTVMRAYGEHKDADSKTHHPLWRIDIDKRSGLNVAYVVSEKVPNWMKIVEHSFDYFEREPEIKNYQPKYANGTPLRFLLKANPIDCVDGKRIGIYKKDDQVKWLKDKMAVLCGFKVLAVEISDCEKEVIQREDCEIKVSSARFKGLLIVTDENKFTKALTNGIGKEKCFGFGLMTVDHRVC